MSKQKEIVDLMSELWDIRAEWNRGQQVNDQWTMMRLAFLNSAIEIEKLKQLETISDRIAELSGVIEVTGSK